MIKIKKYVNCSVTLFIVYYNAFLLIVNLVLSNVIQLVLRYDTNFLYSLIYIIICYHLLYYLFCKTIVIMINNSYTNILDIKNSLITITK